MSAAEILKQIRNLAPAERRDLVERVQLEFHEELEPADDDLSKEQIAELEKRAERLRRNPEVGIPWEQVRAELKERLKKRGACREE